jgi:flavin-dependent dehydrogenase
LNLDVAIVGASAAGLFAAERLARAGAKVSVFERVNRLAPPRRTLIITPQLVQLLGEVPPTLVLHRTPIMAVESRRASVEIALDDADLIVERALLTTYLAERAQLAGATLHLDHRFLGMEPDRGRVRLHFQRSNTTVTSLTSAAVIGADGACSRVAAAAGIPRPPTVPILQAEVALPPGWNPAATKVWFDTDATRFFFWLVPESTECGVLGLIGDNRTEVRPVIERFSRRLGVKARAYQGARVALHNPRSRPWSRVGSTPILLIGDAAGQVKVSTVGGTIAGLWGAIAATRSLVEGMSYAQALRPLKRELDVHWFLRRVLDRLDNSGYDRLVHAVSPGVRHFLAQHNRDAMAGAIWKLPFCHVPLLLLSLQALLRGTRMSQRSRQRDLDLLRG